MEEKVDLFLSSKEGDILNEIIYQANKLDTCFQLVRLYLTFYVAINHCTYVVLNIGLGRIKKNGSLKGTYYLEYRRRGGYSKISARYALRIV